LARIRRLIRRQVSSAVVPPDVYTNLRDSILRFNLKRGSFSDLQGEVLSISDKVDILKHAEDMQRSELVSRREEERKIFTWSSTILLAVIGALLVARQAETVVWESYGVWGKAVASVAIAALVFFSITWQDRQHRFYMQGAQVIVRIEKLLHYFEKGFFDSNGDEALFPEEWANWGEQSVQSALVFKADRRGATWILGVLTIAMIWLA
jgi:hypothetical protein